MPKVTYHKEICLVTYKDGTQEEMELPIGADGYPIMTSLPKGADACRQSFVCFAGSSLASYGGSDRLPYELRKIAKVYDAVGRIGLKQSGVPTGNEQMFGTGILVSRRHILTNSHVLRFMMNEGNPSRFGIEFGAEKGSDYSDFSQFKSGRGQVPDIDAAILTLKEPIPIDKRQYISMSSHPIGQLKDRDVAVIGYPKNQEKTRKNLIRATKRVSTGKVFMHSTSEEGSNFTHVDDMKVGVICHNSSTLGGSSGSPIVDINTGEFLALHFGARILHNDAEDTNLAIPAIHLARRIKRLVSEWL